MIAADDARAQIAEVERRIGEAETAHAQADAEFRRVPTAKAHAALAVAAQLAANARAELEPARAALANCERDDLQGRLKVALEKAQPAALYDAVAPAMARIRELHAELVMHATDIARACAAQALAVREAKEIASELGVAAPIPRAVAATFIRSIIGIRIAHDVYRSGARYPIGQEPHSWLAPRPEVPSAHPRRDEWKAARRVALPDGEFLPAPQYDFDRDQAEVEFYHRPPLNGRPDRAAIL